MRSDILAFMVHAQTQCPNCGKAAFLSTEPQDKRTNAYPAFCPHCKNEFTVHLPLHTPENNDPQNQD
jgi:transcription elongation factor Elf1